MSFLFEHETGTLVRPPSGWQRELLRNRWESPRAPAALKDSFYVSGVEQLVRIA